MMVVATCSGREWSVVDILLLLLLLGSIRYDADSDAMAMAIATKRLARWFLPFS